MGRCAKRQVLRRRNGNFSLAERCRIQTSSARCRELSGARRGARRSPSAGCLVLPVDAYNLAADARLFAALHGNLDRERGTTQTAHHAGMSLVGRTLWRYCAALRHCQSAFRTHGRSRTVLAEWACCGRILAASTLLCGSCSPIAGCAGGPFVELCLWLHPELESDRARRAFSLP